MTQEEIKSLNESGLSTKTPFIISPVIGTQFSIARWSGGIKYQGQPYFYDPVNDELVRHDVRRWLSKHRLRKHRARVKAEKDKQTSLL